MDKIRVPSAYQLADVIRKIGKVEMK